MCVCCAMVAAAVHVALTLDLAGVQINGSRRIKGSRWLRRRGGMPCSTACAGSGSVDVNTRTNVRSCSASLLAFVRDALMLVCVPHCAGCRNSCRPGAVGMQ